MSTSLSQSYENPRDFICFLKLSILSFVVILG